MSREAESPETAGYQGIKNRGNRGKTTWKTAG